jgi:hypothetical protein
VLTCVAVLPVDEDCAYAARRLFVIWPANWAIKELLESSTDGLLPVLERDAPAVPVPVALCKSDTMSWASWLTKESDPFSALWS